MYHFNEMEIAIIDEAEKISVEYLAPRAAEYDETRSFCKESLEMLGQLGFMGVHLPETVGGLGISGPAVSRVVEAVASACASTCSALTAHFLATDSILIGGTDEQREEFLPKAAAGEILGAFALTEPAAGSNPVDMRTRAIPENDGWRIRGTKHYITNAKEADFIILYAKTDVNAGARGISAFIIPKGTMGIEFSSPEKTMGLRGSTIYEIAIDCWLPKSALLGSEGKGFHTAMGVLDRGRIEIASMSLGIARAAYNATLVWSTERDIGDQKLAEYQGIEWIIAEMYTHLESARLLTLKAAKARDDKPRFSLESAVAKYHAAEVAGFITDKALQLHGGYGFIQDLPIERYVRDARILRIFEGTSEVQKIIIARTVLHELKQK